MATLDQLMDADRVDRITREAEQVDVGRAILTAIAAVFFAIGWTLGRVTLAVAWCFTAVRIGWQEGRRRPPEGAG